MISGLNPWLISVGSILILSGLLKANYSGRFFHYLKGLQLLPVGLVPLVAMLLIESEVALGLLLVFNIKAYFVVRLSAALIVSLSIVSLWAIVFRGSIDCGCYGGLLPISAKSSLCLNGVYLVLLYIGFQQITFKSAELLHVLPVLLGIGFSGYLAKNTIGSPWIDFSKLKAEKIWNKAWLPAWQPKESGHLLVMMNDRCSNCKSWLIFLDELDAEQLCPITLILPDRGRSTDEFKANHGINLDILHLPASELNRLIYKMPAAVFIKDNQITARWIDQLPERSQLLSDI